MADAWSLYDRMIDEVPEDVLVREVVSGSHQCLVDAECGVGVAALHRGGTRLRMRGGWAGRPLRELAALARSWDFEVASVGVAALNAWHNQPGRVAALGRVDDVAGTDPFALMGSVAARMAAASGEAASGEAASGVAACGDEARGEAVRGDGTCGDEARGEAARGEAARPRAVVIGHFPRLGRLGEEAEVAVLERAARSDDDLPDTACEYLLPGCDVAVVTGMALENKTMPRLLELAGAPLCCVVGPTSTMCRPLLEAGADLVAGSLVADPELARAVVGCGAPLHGSGALEHVLVTGERGRAAIAALGAGEAAAGDATGPGLR